MTGQAQASQAPCPRLAPHLTSGLDPEGRVLPSASCSCCLSNHSCSGSCLRAAASHRRGPSSSLESLEKPPVTAHRGSRGGWCPPRPHRLRPPRLAGDSQLGVQVPLVGQGRCTHGAGVVQETKAGGAEETWERGGGKEVSGSPSPHPSPQPPAWGEGGGSLAWCPCVWGGNGYSATLA